MNWLDLFKNYTPFCRICFVTSFQVLLEEDINEQSSFSSNFLMIHKGIPKLIFKT